MDHKVSCVYVCMYVCTYVSVCACERVSLSDNKSMLKHEQQSTATNQILQEMLTNNLIYNKSTESGPSCYVTEENG